MASEALIERGQWNMVWLRLRRHRLALCALCVLSVIVLLVLIGPILSPHSYDKVRLRERLPWSPLSVASSPAMRGRCAEREGAEVPRASRGPALRGARSQNLRLLG